MKFAIAMLACRRPHYLAQSLKSLTKCYGIAGWSIHLSVDPAVPSATQEIARMADVFSACDISVHLNPKRFGHTLNFHMAFKRAFEAGSDYVCLCEEDTLQGPDFLRWHEFAADNFANDSHIFTVAGGHYSFKGTYNPVKLPLYNIQHGFMNKGWGTWRDRWYESGGMNERWEKYDVVKADGTVEPCKNGGGYEGYIERQHLKGRGQPYPVVTRVKDFGKEGGVHCNEWVYEHIVKINDWSGNYDCSSLAYRREDAPELVSVTDWEGKVVM